MVHMQHLRLRGADLCEVVQKTVSLETPFPSTGSVFSFRGARAWHHSAGIKAASLCPYGLCPMKTARYPMTQPCVKLLKKEKKNKPREVSSLLSLLLVFVSCPESNGSALLKLPDPCAHGRYDHFEHVGLWNVKCGAKNRRIGLQFWFQIYLTTL